jgi:hypothetical protein
MATKKQTESADAKSDYLNKTWLTALLKKDVSVFRISKVQGVSYLEASGHGSSLLLDPEIIHEPDRIRIVFKISDLFVGNKHFRFREKDGYRKISCIVRVISSNILILFSMSGSFLA